MLYVNIIKKIRQLIDFHLKKCFSAESKENLVIRTCINKDMNSQCGIFKFKNEKIRGCMLTCKDDLCNAAPRQIESQLSFTLLFIALCLALN